MRAVPFTIEEERYLLAQVGSSDPRVTQRALQWLCKKCVNGSFFANPNRIRSTIKLSLYRPDLKVRRWALNALAEIGVGGDLAIVTDQIRVADQDPDLMASVISTIFSQQTDEASSTLLARHGVELEGLHLIAAATHSPNQMARLVAERIPLESAKADELRAAIVLTGKGKAPEHLFLAAHENSIALGELNLHDVPSVSKYSMWAQAELKLGFNSLRIPISQLDSSPDEVRKWFLRLLFSDAESLSRNIDLIRHAQNDESNEVREEAAIELRRTFVKDMAPAVTKWFFNEPHAETRFALLEHMAANSDYETSYANIVIEVYEKQPIRSDARTRIEAAAARTSLHGQLRKLALIEEGRTLFGVANDLFDGRGSVTNITQNFPNAKIGAVTATGNISAETISAVQGVEAEELRGILERALAIITQLPDERQRTEGGALVKEIAEKPTKGGFQRLIGYFTTAKRGAEAVGGLAGSVDGLIDNLSDLAHDLI